MRFLPLLLCVAVCVAQEADITSGVDLVAVGLSVTGGTGESLGDVRPYELLVLDNGQPRTIDSLWRENDVPLTIGLIVDLSSSQQEHIASHQKSVGTFLGHILRAQDQAFLVSVGNEARLVTPMTHSVDQLRAGMKALDLLSPAGTILGDVCGKSQPWMFRCGGTALWNAVYASAELEMKGISGRKALLVFSDGWDSGSTHGLEETIRAAEDTDTLVYAIRYDIVMPTRFPSRGVLARAAAAEHDYQRLADETGGREMDGTKTDATLLFAQIESELRSLYVLTFKIPDGGMDGKFHKLDVRTQRAGAHVRARAGYVASH